MNAWNATEMNFRRQKRKHYRYIYHCCFLQDWRLQENRFFLGFGLIIHFMVTTLKAKRCIFISMNPKCPGYPSILDKSRYLLFLNKVLNNRYRLLLLPRTFWGSTYLLLVFVVVAIKWIIRPKTKKNLFSWSLHLNFTRNSSDASRSHASSNPTLGLWFKVWNFWTLLKIYKTWLVYFEHQPSSNLFLG